MATPLSLGQVSRPGRSEPPAFSIVRRPVLFLALGLLLQAITIGF